MVLVVVLDEVVLEEVVVDVLVVDEVVEVEEVVVVVGLTSGAQRTSTLRLALSRVAHAAPVKVASRPIRSRASGARTNARTSLLAPKLTLLPRKTFSSGVGALPTGPNNEPS